MRTQHPFALALAQANHLGEGLQWHGPSGRWWWTDIQGACIHAWTPGASATLQLRLPERVGCFVHARSGALVLAMAKRVARLKLPDLQATGSIAVQPEEIVPLEAHLPTTRANDGRCDRSGAFVFGTLDESEPRHPLGGFYQYTSAQGLRRLALDGVAIANSICFSLDGRTMYFCDTLTQRIQQCDYDAETAQVDNVRHFTQMDREDAWPDGSVIDAEGCLWNAQWGVGRVARYDPDGRLMGVWTAPAAQTSCPAIGGDGLDQLMLTTARTGLSREALAAQPLSGGLFGLRLTPGLGVPDTLFDD